MIVFVICVVVNSNLFYDLSRERLMENLNTNEHASVTADQVTADQVL